MYLKDRLGFDVVMGLATYGSLIAAAYFAYQEEPGRTLFWAACYVILQFERGLRR
jgi:hypothetical protein